MSIETTSIQSFAVSLLAPITQNMPLWFQQGGFVMWLLLLASFLTTIVTLERLFVWTVYSFQKEHFALQKCFAALNKREKTNALLACQKVDTPTLKMLEYGIKALPFTPKEKMQSYAETQVSVMSRGQSILNTVITMVPMLGILGSVIGIITSFNTLSLQGVDDTIAIISSISQALIPTAAGLGVALFALLPYHFFRTLIQKLILRLESIGSEFNHICQQKSLITNQLSDVAKAQETAENETIAAQKDMPYHYEFSKETGEVNVNIHPQSKQDDIKRSTPSSIANMFNEELPSIYKHIKPEPEDKQSLDNAEQQDKKLADEIK